MPTDPLHAAFERFLRDRDEAALLAVVHEHGGRAPSKEVHYPVAHRICDVRLGGSVFRVVRVADLDDHTTRLHIYLTDSPSLTQPGVPFRLRGEALWRWLEDESKSPHDAPADWSRYDASLRGDA
jgi:hypothetical protein